MNIVDKMKEKEVVSQIKKEKSWVGDMKRFPILYISLFMAAFLTFIDGIYIAYSATSSIDDGFVKIVLTIVIGSVIGIAFACFAEGAVAFWENKLLHREPDNNTQFVTSIIMLVVSGLFAITTSYASTNVIATMFGIFSEHQQIPSWVQSWLLLFLPLGILANITASYVYRNNSREAKLRRALESEILLSKIKSDEEMISAEGQAQIKLAQLTSQRFIAEMERDIEAIGNQKGVDAWIQKKKDMGVNDVIAKEEESKSPIEQPKEKENKDFPDR